MSIREPLIYFTCCSLGVDWSTHATRAEPTVAITIDEPTPEKIEHMKMAIAESLKKMRGT